VWQDWAASQEQDKDDEKGNSECYLPLIGHGHLLAKMRKRNANDRLKENPEKQTGRSSGGTPLRR
jgi:hypothetical protein